MVDCVVSDIDTCSVDLCNGLHITKRYTKDLLVTRKAVGVEKNVRKLKYIFRSWLGHYARVVYHLAVGNVAQGEPLGGGSSLHFTTSESTLTLTACYAASANPGQKPYRTMYCST